MKRFACLLITGALLCALFTGCKGKALPDGMEKEELVAAGLKVVLSVVDGDYETVYSAFREDVRSGTSAQAVQELALTGMDGAGVFRQIDSTMTTGQTVEGNDIGVAVFYCDFTDDDVLFRVSFDEQMQLVGLSVQKQ